jgi:hypothetical protein
MNTRFTRRVPSVPKEFPISNVPVTYINITVPSNWFLLNETFESLYKISKGVLVEFCKERGLIETGTKQQLINHLLDWSKYALPSCFHNNKQQKDTFEENDDFNPKTQVFHRNNSGEERKKGKKSKSDEKKMRDHKIVHFVSPPLSDKSGGNGGSNSDDQGKKRPRTVSTDRAEIDPEDIVIERKIGSGGFKEVFLGRLRGDRVAVGVIQATSFEDSSQFDDLLNELEVLKQLLHENVVRFIGVAKKFSIHEEKKVLSEFLFVTEFCMFGDLSDYMQAVEKPSVKKQLSLMYDIAFGCAYLHGRRPAIIHRDLKSLNILIDENGRAKIGDFGLAKIKRKVKAFQMNTVVGTTNWQAPEMWSEKPVYTEKVDVYSCALIFWEILEWSNVYPFPNMNEFAIYQQVGKENLRPKFSAYKGIPKKILELIERMWDKDPSVRPSMLEVASKISEVL